MIDTADIAALAELYDRYANALERTAPERLRARRQFYARLETLYDREARDLAYEAFRFEMVQHCKDYLRKN